MNPRLAVVVLVIIAVAVGVGLYASQDGKDEDAVTIPVETAVPVTDPPRSEAGDSETTVTLNENGFSPRSVTVSVGESVMFRNESGSPAIVASDPHPQHTNLSEFESDTIPAGETYTFTFERAGTFGMHNHLNPSQTGEVTVE